MDSIYTLAAFWFLAAVLSTILANRLKISIALMEIIIGAVVGYTAFQLNFTDKLSLNADWIKFCTGVGAIMLTFLAGAELNPDVMKSKLKEVSIVGFIGFFAPFTGCFINCILSDRMGPASEFIMWHCSFHNINGRSLRSNAGIWI